MTPQKKALLFTFALVAFLIFLTGIALLVSPALGNLIGSSGKATTWLGLKLIAASLLFKFALCLWALRLMTPRS